MISDGRKYDEVLNGNTKKEMAERHFHVHHRPAAIIVLDTQCSMTQRSANER